MSTPKTPVVRRGSREEQEIYVSYKTHAVLPIYTVKSGKSLGSDRGYTTFT